MTELQIFILLRDEIADAKPPRLSTSVNVYILRGLYEAYGICGIVHRLYWENDISSDEFNYAIIALEKWFNILRKEHIQTLVKTGYWFSGDNWESVKNDRLFFLNSVIIILSNENKG